MSMHKATQAPKVTTRDIGLAVRDALEHITHVPIYLDDSEIGRMQIWDVDVSDPHNVLIDLANGQTFVARIVTVPHP